jgi:hypothetical protein
MPIGWFRAAVLGVLANLALQSSSYAVSCNPGDLCATQTIQDFYFGGINTANGQDVIGSTNVFDVSSAVLTLDVTTNTLTVQINTNFAGAPASTNSRVANALLGQSYGALFLGPGGAGSTWLAFHPTPPAPGNTYPNDVYHPGEWTAAVNVNSSSNHGTAGVYSVGSSQNGGSETPIINSSYPGAAPNSNTGNVPVAYSTTDKHGHHLGDVKMSNEYGNPITYPHHGNGKHNGKRFRFREGQAVQFTPDPSASTISGTASSSYEITPTVWGKKGNVTTEGSITYTIDDFSALDLGLIFAFSWSMSCGNDVIEGVADFSPLDHGGGGATPIPASLPLFIAGLGLLGLIGLRRSRTGAYAARVAT